MDEQLVEGVVEAAEIIAEPALAIDYTEILNQILQAQYVLIILFAAFLVYLVFFRKGR